MNSTKPHCSGRQSQPDVKSQHVLDKKGPGADGLPLASTTPHNLLRDQIGSWSSAPLGSADGHSSEKAGGLIPAVHGATAPRTRLTALLEFQRPPNPLMRELGFANPFYFTLRFKAASARAPATTQKHTPPPPNQLPTNRFTPSPTRRPPRLPSHFAKALLTNTIPVA